MLLLIFTICLGISAIALLVLMAYPSKGSKPVHKRLAALDQEFAPEEHDDNVADIRKSQQKLSAIPWLNHWLTRLNLATASSLYLYQAGVTTTVGALMLMSIAGSVVAGLILYLRFGASPVTLLAGIFLTFPFLYVQRKRAKRLAKLEAQLPEALGTMVSALRVGHSLIASLGAVAQESEEPIAGEMRKCFEEQNYGIEMRTALINLTQRSPVQDYRIFVAAVLIQKESGGNLAEVLEKVAQTARERFRLKKQVAVHTAQGRMTGWILSLLPAVLGLGMYFMSPDSMSVLWTNPIGRKMLTAAVCMDVMGALIIRKIVGISV